MRSNSQKNVCEGKTQTISSRSLKRPIIVECQEIHENCQQTSRKQVGVVKSIGVTSFTFVDPPSGRIRMSAININGGTL
jgi:hypothetical protein